MSIISIIVLYLYVTLVVYTVLGGVKIKIFIAKISKTHPYNFGDPAYLENIKGAASACWQENYNELNNCKHVIAVYKDKIVGAFDKVQVIRATDAKNYETVLRENVVYPPYRKYEISAHVCKNAAEIESVLGEHISIFEKVVKVDFHNKRSYKNWKKRCFLILDSPCSNDKINKLIGKSFTKVGLTKVENSNSIYKFNEV